MSGSSRTNADISGASKIEHFRTDHLLPNIRHHAISSGFATFGAQAAKFIINFLGAAVLARLLSPNEFGLVSMVLGITALVGIFNVLGLSTATVQSENITQQQVSNLFWVNLGGSGILTAICVCLAPFIAWFYRDPRVERIMLVLSLTFILAGATVQHQALLTRQIRFIALGIIDVASMLAGFAIACWLALKGFDYWALVAQQLVTAAVALVLTWYISGWRPVLPKRNSGVRPMVVFGAHLTAADFVARLTLTSDTILVGRFFGAGPLGLYTRANVLLARPVQQVLTPIASVLVPVLSRLQSDPVRYRRMFMRAYEMMVLAVLPFSAICFALSRPLVLVILGSKWEGAIPLFSGFALATISWPLASVGSWIFESQGRGLDQLHNHSLSGAVIVGAYCLGLHWGPIGMVVALASASLVIRLPIVFYLAGRTGPVSVDDLWFGFLSHLPCWGAFYFSTALAYQGFKNAAPIIQLLACLPIGLVIGVPLALVFRRPRESATHALKTIKTSLAGWRKVSEQA